MRVIYGLCKNRLAYGVFDDDNKYDPEFGSYVDKSRVERKLGFHRARQHYQSLPDIFPLLVGKDIRLNLDVRYVSASDNVDGSWSMETSRLERSYEDNVRLRGVVNSYDPVTRVITIGSDSVVIPPMNQPIVYEDQPFSLTPDPMAAPSL